MQLVVENDCYLSRPGFWWSGIEVVACWFGVAERLVRLVRQLAWTHLEADDTQLCVDTVASCAMSPAFFMKGRGDCCHGADYRGSVAIDRPYHTASAPLTVEEAHA